MPALKCSVGIQRKRGSGFQPLRRGKMPRPLIGAEPRNLANIVSRGIRGNIWEKFSGVRQDCAIVARRPHSRIRGAGVDSIISGKREGEPEGARRPTAGSETGEFTSRVERGRVPPLFEKLQFQVDDRFPISALSMRRWLIPMPVPSRTQKTGATATVLSLKIPVIR